MNRARRSNCKVASIALLFFSFSSFAIHAQTGGSKAPQKDLKPGNAANQPPVTTQSPAAMVTQAFTQRGINKCTERVGQFSQFLIGGAQVVGGQVFVAPEEADRRLASASLEIQAGQSVAYAGMSFTPDSGANRCGGVYELVGYWPNTCEDIATKQYASFKRVSPLRQAIIALEGVQTKRVFLMPAGAGCVTIIKETVF